MTDQADFAQLTGPFRAELLAHCYRMLGSVHDAEDQVQETLIRAWRSYDDFEGRASLRTWLYKIATNTCLRALENRSRRPLPSGLGAPGASPDGPLATGPVGQEGLAQEEVREPAETGQRSLLDRYAAAFGNAGASALSRLLQEDAIFEMPPILTWFAGRGRIGQFLGSRVFGQPGDFKMVPVAANTQPGFACYLLGHDGRHHAHAAQVLTVGDAGIAHVVSFNQPELVPVFGLPEVLPAATGTGRPRQ
jgi:RNA polymerase sigma factor (sigma-70 family)